jgi:hypothetical protein
MTAAAEKILNAIIVHELTGYISAGKQFGRIEVERGKRKRLAEALRLAMQEK